MTEAPKLCSNAADARHYKEIHPKTREFIENLREEDVALLQDGIRLVLALRTVSKFTKWVIITLVGTFIGAVALAENIGKLMAFIRGGK